MTCRAVSVAGVSEADLEGATWANLANVLAVDDESATATTSIKSEQAVTNRIDVSLLFAGPFPAARSARALAVQVRARATNADAQYAQVRLACASGYLSANLAGGRTLTAGAGFSVEAFTLNPSTHAMPTGADLNSGATWRVSFLRPLAAPADPTIEVDAIVPAARACVPGGASAVGRTYRQGRLAGINRTRCI